MRATGAKAPLDDTEKRAAARSGERRRQRRRHAMREQSNERPDRTDRLKTVVWVRFFDLRSRLQRRHFRRRSEKSPPPRLDAREPPPPRTRTALAFSPHAQRVRDAKCPTRIRRLVTRSPRVSWRRSARRRSKPPPSSILLPPTATVALRCFGPRAAPRWCVPWTTARVQLGRLVLSRAVGSAASLRARVGPRRLRSRPRSGRSRDLANRRRTATEATGAADPTIRDPRRAPSRASAAPPRPILRPMIPLTPLAPSLSSHSPQRPAAVWNDARSWAAPSLPPPPARTPPAPR